MQIIDQIMHTYHSCTFWLYACIDTFLYIYQTCIHTRTHTCIQIIHNNHTWILHFCTMSLYSHTQRSYRSYRSYIDTYTHSYIRGHVYAFYAFYVSEIYACVEQLPKDDAATDTRTVFMYMYMYVHSLNVCGCICGCIFTMYIYVCVLPCTRMSTCHVCILA